jgi:hypothetical protein
MLETAPRKRNKVENRIPEKNMGLVSTMANPIRPSQLEGKPPVWAIWDGILETGPGDERQHRSVVQAV